MVANREAIKALITISESWGGSIRLIPRSEFQDTVDNSYDWDTSPDFGHAVHYKNKQIIVDHTSANAGSLIHEMGHVFASKKEPNLSKEWDWFGWEICLARLVDCYRIWSRSSLDYIVSDRGLDTWAGCSTHRKQDITSERIKCAMRSGIVNKNYIPLPVR